MEKTQKWQSKAAVGQGCKGVEEAAASAGTK